MRAGDADKVQLRYWAQAWLQLVRDLYRAHDELMAAWQHAAVPAPGDSSAAARLAEAYTGWDTAIDAIDETHIKQMAMPGLKEPDHHRRTTG